MKLDEKMEKALSLQFNAEMESAFLYLSMAAWLDAHDLRGCSHWMKKQFEEEQEHAMKLYEYSVARGGRIIVDAVPTPRCDWENVTAVFDQVYAHEQKVTSLIHGLVDLAAELKDYATSVKLDWFVNEQVEEEENSYAIVAKLKKYGEEPLALAMLDNELSKR